MYGIISKEDFPSFEEVCGEPAFHIREGDTSKAFIEATRLQLDFLLIDVDFSINLEEEIHKYRVQRPFTRIILLAKGREPGDPLLAKLVSMGIYDIVSEVGEDFIKELFNRIKSPATYAQGARWIKTGHIPVYQGKKSSIETIREVLIQHKPLGLTTIAIAGAGSGAGVSHLSLAIANHLTRRGNQVVLAEWPVGNENEISSQYAYLSSMGASIEIKKINGVEIETTSFNKFDIFLDARCFRSIDYIFPFINQYNYLVLDLGEIKPEKIAEMDRAALSILVVNASPYRIEKFLPLVDENDMSLYIPNLPRWKIALNLANDKEIKWFINSFSKFLGKIYPVPYMPNFNDETELISDILQPILPLSLPRKKKPFWKFR